MRQNRVAITFAKVIIQNHSRSARGSASKDNGHPAAISSPAAIAPLGLRRSIYIAEVRARRACVAVRAAPAARAILGHAAAASFENSTPRHWLVRAYACVRWCEQRDARHTPNESFASAFCTFARDLRCGEWGEVDIEREGRDRRDGALASRARAHSTSIERPRDCWDRSERCGRA